MEEENAPVDNDIWNSIHNLAPALGRVIDDGFKLTDRLARDTVTTFDQLTEECRKSGESWDRLVEEGLDGIILACTDKSFPISLRLASWNLLATGLDNEDACCRLFSKMDAKVFIRLLTEVSSATRLDSSIVTCLNMLAKFLGSVNITDPRIRFDGSHAALFVRLLRAYVGIDEWNGSLMPIYSVVDDYSPNALVGMVMCKVDPQWYVDLLPLIRGYCGAIAYAIYNVGVKIDSSDDGAADADSHEVRSLLIERTVSVIKELNVSFSRTDTGLERFYASINGNSVDSVRLRATGRSYLLYVSLSNVINIIRDHWLETLRATDAAAISTLVYHVFRSNDTSDTNYDVAIDAAMHILPKITEPPLVALWIMDSLFLRVLERSEPKLQHKMLILVRYCLSLFKDLISRWFSFKRFTNALNILVEQSDHEGVVSECLIIAKMALTSGGHHAVLFKQTPIYDTLLCLDNRFSLAQPHHTLYGAVFEILQTDIQA